jgi:hypothetical protein
MSTNPPGYITITIHAKPGARHNAVNVEADNSLAVQVTEPPEKGKANRAILKLLAKELGVPSSALELVQGATSTTKTIRIQGIDPAALETRLQGLNKV